ncbi:hypothetical protein ACFFSW_29620 [Saccharothrix longispora]|uniref:Uncharacterized protein n=1 Tax=Saccharothrix longispora TaxID=33920 RepID=A0ABU1PWK5_9PSEU|nr:hypothetical protein [Saccharothrix longispora]MDR6595021.1 hypothetical protein [Saccharothrix longispora]
MSGKRFLPGLELSRRFYREAVEPLVRAHFGEVPHSAALIGPGSGVLGFGTERSARRGGPGGVVGAPADGVPGLPDALRRR